MYSADVRSLVKNNWSSYFETLFWSETLYTGEEEEDESEHCADDYIAEHDSEISLGTLRTVYNCLAKFFQYVETDYLSLFKILDDLESVGLRSDLLAHDLVLSQNRHGAGFWDGDYDVDLGVYNIGEVLDSCAKKVGEHSLYLGDDGRIYSYYLGL